MKVLTISRAPFTDAFRVIFISKIALILSLLPALRSFTISGLGLLPTLPPRKGLQAQTPVLKSLDLVRMTQVELGGPARRKRAFALEFLQLFSTISELVMDDFSVDHEWEAGGPEARAMVLLPEMPLVFQSQSAIIPPSTLSATMTLEIIRRTSAKTLRRLNTRYRPVPELSALQALVDEVSPQLSELSLGMDDDRSVFIFSESFHCSLSEFSRL